MWLVVPPCVHKLTLIHGKYIFALDSVVGCTTRFTLLKALYIIFISTLYNTSAMDYNGCLVNDVFFKSLVDPTNASIHSVVIK